MKSPFSQRLRVLTEPMMIAALITWLAVALGSWGSSTTELLPISAAATRLLRDISLVLFLVLLIGCSLRERDDASPLRLSIASVQIICALLVCLLTRNTFGSILLIIVMAELAGLLSWRHLMLAFLATNAALLLVHSLRWGWADAAIAGLSIAGFQLFAIMMTTYARRAETASAELLQVNAHLLATRTLLAESARDQERLRISRELHDVAGHKLTAMKLHLLALARDPRMQDVAEVGTCAQLADELLGDIREVVKQMRAHDGMSLAAAIEQIAQAMPRPRAHIDVEADASVGNALQAEALLRAVQEAITNAARHGNAENIWIVLRRRDDRIELDMRDDGRGSGTVRFGNGLSGMRERIEALGGDLQPATSPGRGFALHAWIPAT
jgi:signal transduction histidine kinase